MCLSTDHPNRVQVCTVGELSIGATYRTPDRETMMVTDGQHEEGEVAVVSLTTGRIVQESVDVRLAQDRQGRLYASRYLNPPDLTLPDANPFAGNQPQ